MVTAADKRREERIKLFATAFSNLGVASVVTGVIAPLAAGRAQIAAAALGLVIGLALHVVGQGVLHFVVRSSGEEA